MIMKTWKSEVISLLNRLGGQASLDEIYNEFENNGSRPRIPNYKAVIRATLERGCRDSLAFDGDELFYMVNSKGGGKYGLLKQWNFDWVDFYVEFAEKLLTYKNKRQDLIVKVKNVFKNIGVELPTLEEKDSDIIDIDPFTIFGTFNKSMKASSRQLIIGGYAKEFSVKSPIPQSFDGIPVLMPMNATFYAFKSERGEDVIDNVWEIFEAAINYAKDKSSKNQEKFKKYFDIVINHKYMANRITMGLFWINPEEYINLDGRNRWYIFDSKQLPETFVSKLPRFENKPTSSEYLELIDKFKEYFTSNGAIVKNFKELSQVAWVYANEVNEQEKNEKKLQKQEDDNNSVRYWLYAPGHGASEWQKFYKKGIMAIGWDEIGDLTQYASKDEIKQALKTKINPNYTYRNDAHALWQFSREMKPGDVVFVKKGKFALIGRGVVQSKYYFDPKIKDYCNVCKVKWTHNGEWKHPGHATMKTLTDVTRYTDYVNKLNEIFSEEGAELLEEKEQVFSKYTEEDFLNEVYISENEYSTIKKLLETKKNVILQGPPGVGKTFAAKKLAYSIMGEKNNDRIGFIQFHQSYSYEDFIMGYRPSEEGFRLTDGVFYKFCKNAEIDSDNPYFFIIDEINRGNLSKIFGELFMLIENDKRGQEIELIYTGEKFTVPQNVYIIGMMNTADRSLALLDYALRRRFAFYTMSPAFNSVGFLNYKTQLHSQQFNNLISCVESLNKAISEDESLGEGFCIGHSFFCDLNNIFEDELNNIVEYEIIPLIKEYWFDEPDKLRIWISNLRSSLK